MAAYKIAEAKAKLSRLVEQAKSGETIEIMRRGRRVARLVAVEATRLKIDFDDICAFTDSMPFQEGDAATLIRQMRDEGY